MNFNLFCISVNYHEKHLQGVVMHNQHANPARLFPDKNTKAVFVQEGVYVRGSCKTSSYNLGETVTTL